MRLCVRFLFLSAGPRDSASRGGLPHGLSVAALTCTVPERGSLRLPQLLCDISLLHHSKPFCLMFTWFSFIIPIKTFKTCQSFPGTDRRRLVNASLVIMIMMMLMITIMTVIMFVIMTIMMKRGDRKCEQFRGKNFKAVHSE